MCLAISASFRMWQSLQLYLFNFSKTYRELSTLPNWSPLRSDRCMDGWIDTLTLNAGVLFGGAPPHLECFCSAMVQRVAVVGAGSSGLTCVKVCIDEGLEPVCFEGSDDIGGLWKFKVRGYENRSWPGLSEQNIFGVEHWKMEMLKIWSSVCRSPRSRTRPAYTALWWPTPPRR